MTTVNGTAACPQNTGIPQDFQRSSFGTLRDAKVLHEEPELVRGGTQASHPLDHAREHDEATAREKLGKVLAKLDPEDRLIIQMRYWSGFTVVRIAKTLKIEQRQLYDRIARILKLLKVLLRDDGLKLDDVRSILGD